MSNQRIPTGIFVSVSGRRRTLYTAGKRPEKRIGCSSERPMRSPLFRKLALLIGGPIMLIALLSLGTVFLNRHGSANAAELETPTIPPTGDTSTAVAQLPPPASATPPGSAPVEVKPAPKNILPATLIQGPPAPKPLPTATKIAVAAKPPLQIKRRQTLDRLALTRQLMQVSEVEKGSLRVPWLRLADVRGLRDADLPEAVVLQLRKITLSGLPFRMGVDCHLDKEEAENLQVLSRQLRDHITNSMAASQFDCRLNAGSLRQNLVTGKDADNPWLHDQAVPVLTQLLQSENRPVRLLLVELLTRITGARSTNALARRAIYDLDADVREGAVRTLAGRPRRDSRAVFLEGLRYPWAPVADHAAEALIALNDQEALPALQQLAAESEPPTPSVRKDEGRSSLQVRELVRVNHLANCAMCHPRSSSESDLVRAAIPVRGQPSSSAYSTQPSSSFIHADITYLQQDFSIMQPVDDHGSWPAYQRFDYLIRSRPASDRDLAQGRFTNAGNPQAEAVRFAIQELAKQQRFEAIASTW